MSTKATMIRSIEPDENEVPARKEHPGAARAGWIEVVAGSMFSGKSEELIRRLRRAQIAKRKVQIFKPRIDNRYSDTHITSHSAMQINADSVSTSRELLARVLPETEVVGIDEGQFFDAELPAVCSTLADQGKRIIVAGLDQDYLGKPFEPMPQLLAIAEYITKTLAICMVCGAPANRTYRKVARGGRVVVGGADLYEARCRRCFDLGQRAKAAAPVHQFPEETHEIAKPVRRRRAAAARPRRRVR